jgi:hypothetical protein
MRKILRALKFILLSLLGLLLAVCGAGPGYRA